MEEYIDDISSRERVTWLKQLSRTPDLVGDEFDPEELSFVIPGIAITCWEGAGRVSGRPGFFVINVADELDTPSDIKVPINPWEGVQATRVKLDRIAEIIEGQHGGPDSTNVVVHCAMGIERSALAVAWFLRSKNHHDSLTGAYDAISAARPIVADRSGWVDEELDPPNSSGAHAA